jgi:hypothetical protein
LTLSRSEPGYALSAAIHFGLLAAMVVAFSFPRKFDDAHEAVPVETISDAQFSQIMKGVKTAKAPTAKPRVDKVAAVEELKPTPPTPEAKRDAPAPPAQGKPQPDPSEADSKPTPAPPLPPTRPAPPAPKPPQEAKQEPEDKDAEPVKPPTRPKPPTPDAAQAKPTPKPPEKPVEKPAPEKPAPKPPKLDEVAKLLADSKDKPPPKPKSGEENADRHASPNLAEIARLLSKEAPSAIGSAGHEVSRTASLGAPTASAARMSPSLADALSGLLQEQYKQCWSYLALSNTPRYVAKIRVAYLPDGSLATQPVLTNPPADPQSRALAESAMRAVRRCNPLHIPAKFQPYYEQWKDWVVGFDPDSLN